MNESPYLQPDRAQISCKEPQQCIPRRPLLQVQVAGQRHQASVAGNRHNLTQGHPES